MGAVVAMVTAAAVATACRRIGVIALHLACHIKTSRVHSCTTPAQSCQPGPTTSKADRRAMVAAVSRRISRGNHSTPARHLTMENSTSDYNDIKFTSSTHFCPALTCVYGELEIEASGDITEQNLCCFFVFFL